MDKGNGRASEEHTGTAAESRASMFAHHPYPAALIAPDGTVRETNFGMDRLLDLEQGRAIGLRMLDLVASEDSERLHLALARATRLERVQDFALLLALPGRPEIGTIATLAPAEPVGIGVFLILRTIGERISFAQDQLALAERTLQLQAAALDSLPAHVALLDSVGRITAVNEAWRRFGRENGLDDPAFCIGEDYLAVCRSAAADSPEAAAALAGLEEVLSGSRAAFEVEYPCHGPVRRWFRLHANYFRSHLAVGAVVMHVNVTERHLADEKAHFAVRALRRLSKAAESAESAYQHRLDHAARHDGLTGLVNRSAFESFTRQALDSAVDRPGVCALMLVDIDSFRILNDSLGYTRADAFLQEAASRLRMAVPPGDLTARLGADEFAVMLVGLPDAPMAQAYAARICEQMRAAVTTEHGVLSMTASIGFSCYPGDGEGYEELLRAATVALREAKKNGPNSIRGYEPRLGPNGAPELSLRSEIAAAIRTGQFAVFYQPIIDLAGGRARSVEALVRWRHPERGLLMPAEFISVAEESGAIVELGDWVLHRACEDAMRLRAAIGCPIRVAVNLSARQFDRAGLVMKVSRALQISGLEPANLRLEITETTVMADPDASCAILSELAAMGVGLALDDFGTGYSSLGYLQIFPLTCLKIDRSFVAGLPKSERATAIARAVLLLGKALRMSIVAEGVENDDQLTFLRTNGCDEVQGYLFAAPVAYEEASRWLAAYNSSAAPIR